MLYAPCWWLLHMNVRKDDMNFLYDWMYSIFMNSVQIERKVVICQRVHFYLITYEEINCKGYGKHMARQSLLFIPKMFKKHCLCTIFSLWPEGPKFEMRSTHARTNWDPNNAFPWGVRRHICMVVLAICSGMGATNFISRAPTDFRSWTNLIKNGCCQVFCGT